MVVAVETMRRSAESAPNLTKKKIVDLMRQEIASSGKTLQQASVKVCADLIDQGFKDALFDLFVCDGMEAVYRQDLSARRTGVVESEPVKATVKPVPEHPGEPSQPQVEPTVEEIERPPNNPYNPDKARGIGDRIIQELPALVGRAAVDYWVADGRTKPLGYLSRKELETSIERTKTLAGTYQHSTLFQERVLAGMGKEHEFVYQAFPDLTILDTLWEIRPGAAKP